MRLARWMDAWGLLVLLALGLALFVDHWLHKGIQVARRRHRVLTVFSLVLALATGFVYFMETAAIAIMVPNLKPPATAQKHDTTP